MERRRLTDDYRHYTDPVDRLVVIIAEILEEERHYKDPYRIGIPSQEIKERFQPNPRADWNAWLNSMVQHGWIKPKDGGFMITRDAHFRVKWLHGLTYKHWSTAIHEANKWFTS